MLPPMLGTLVSAVGLRGLAVAAVVALAGLGLWRYTVVQRAAGAAAERVQWEQLEVERQSMASEAQRMMRMAIEGAERVRQTERSYLTRAAAESRNEHDSLRDEISAFAGACGDTPAACRERATTLGGLLEAALRTSETCALSAEDVAADARLLRDAAPGRVGFQ